MATLSNILLEKEILLESGTNELEVLVFDVADYTFGINVAKVREVLPVASITSLPKAHPSIRGVFKLRNQVIPCVSLLDHLGIQSTRDSSESTMILTDLNQQQTAFLVDQVERIHRLSWQNILAVPGLEALSHTPVTALARCEDRLIVMLDFEMILDDVTDQYFRTDEVANPMGLPREQFKLLLAEDSPTVRQAIEQTLRASGYTNLAFFENGADAWAWIEGRFAETHHADQVGDLLIADVEMPQVDGLHLTKRVKEHPELRKIPVLLYSSIITPDNRKKGSAVGADAQVSKPELAHVVELADRLIADARRDQRGQSLREIHESCQAAPATRAKTESVSPPRPAAAAKPRPVATPAPKPAAPARAAGQAAVWKEDLLGPKSDEASAAALKAIEAELQCDAAPDTPPPANTDAKLWRTFHRELSMHVAHLRESLLQARADGLNDSMFQDVARTLHTIKSASMVVPVEPVTRCTHLMESLLDPSRKNPELWPHRELDRYLQWLSVVIAPSGSVDGALAAGAELESALAGQIPHHAAR